MAKVNLLVFHLLLIFTEMVVLRKTLEIPSASSQNPRRFVDKHKIVSSPRFHWLS